MWAESTDVRAHDSGLHAKRRPSRVIVELAKGGLQCILIQMTAGRAAFKQGHHERSRKRPDHP